MLKFSRAVINGGLTIKISNFRVDRIRVWKSTDYHTQTQRAYKSTVGRRQHAPSINHSLTAVATLNSKREII